MSFVAGYGMQIRLPKDLREFIALLNSTSVEYVVVGAHATAFHGRPRYTADLDFLINPTAENARRALAALKSFGFSSLGVTEADLTSPNMVVQLGVNPARIDLLTSLSGVSVEEVFAGRVAGELDGLPVFFIGREEHIRNKRSTGRLQDIADAEAIE